MLKSFTLGSYCPGNSILHKADPRAKILLTLLVMVTLFFIKSITLPLLLLVLVFTCASYIGKTLQQSLRGLKPIIYLAGVAVLVNLFSIEGTPLFDGTLLRHISKEGLVFSTRMIVRLALLGSTAALLTFTTTPLALTQALESLLKPLNKLGLHTSDFTMILFISLRFLPVVAEEAEKLMKQRPQQSESGTGAKQLNRIRWYADQLVPLFAAVANHGSKLATAMEARCYRGSTWRTRMRPLEFSRIDLVCLGVAMMVLTGIMFIEKNYIVPL